MQNDDLVTFLRDPANYPGGATSVEFVETHISWVFLVGDHAFKVKKPVKFDFVDFSTPTARQKACQREIRLNQRLAPDTYLDVLELYCSNGAWSFSGLPPAAEYCVRMRRLPADRMLDQLLRQSPPIEVDLRPLAQRLTAFYLSAKSGERIARGGSAAAIEAHVRANFKVLRELAQDSAIDRLESAQIFFLAQNRKRFQERVDSGKVRDGHGDLRAEHVCMLDPPVVFDCIEFNDRLRHVDILDDLAFFVMDLEFLGHSPLALAFWNHMAIALREDPTDPLFDFYLCYRACVRAKVSAIRAAQSATEPLPVEAAISACRPHVQLAMRYADRFHHPRLLVTVGLMGSGKSTLSSALANQLGMRRISSDDVRQELWGKRDRSASFGEGLYHPQRREEIYEELFRRANVALGGGVSVILDATFLRRDQRDHARKIAQQWKVPPLFLELRIAKTDAIARLDQRVRKNRGASDGRPELYDDQANLFEPVDELPANEHLMLNARLDVNELVATVLEAL